VVYRGDDIELKLAVRGGLEDTRVDLDLFDSRTVELFEGRDDSRLLAGA
jgi:hypothetical protein